MLVGKGGGVNITGSVAAEESSTAVIVEMGVGGSGVGGSSVGGMVAVAAISSTTVCSATGEGMLVCS